MGKGFDEPTAFILVHDLREAPIVRAPHLLPGLLRPRSASAALAPYSSDPSRCSDPGLCARRRSRAPQAGVLVSPEASSGIIQMVKMANEYYPDMSIRHVFLNAPPLMSTLLSALKPFLSNRTQKKLIWAPSGQELQTLLQMVHITQARPPPAAPAPPAPPARSATACARDPVR